MEESILYTNVGNGVIEPQIQDQEVKKGPQSVVRDLVSKDKRDKTKQMAKGEQLDQDLIIKEPLPTPVMVERLEELLVEYSQDKFNYIIDGFTDGFRIGFTGDHCPHSCINLRSARQHPDIFRPKFRKRLQKVALPGLLRKSHWIT